MLNVWSWAVAVRKESAFLFFIFTLRCTLCNAWLPDTSSKLTNEFSQIASTKFLGNATFPDYFIVLHQDENYILLGGRNNIYNLSIFDLTENKDSRIEWLSSEAHSQLCLLKGKGEDDCQNYIRILTPVAPGELLTCGTNSYKPLCRYYSMKVRFNIFSYRHCSSTVQ